MECYTQKTDMETAWTTKAWIEVKKKSSFAFIDDFKCDRSGKKLDDECLLVSRTNFRHQGNETDELYKFNRDSTPDEYSVVWENWDTFKKLEERKRRMAKNKEIKWEKNKDGVWEIGKKNPDCPYIWVDYDDGDRCYVFGCEWAGIYTEHLKAKDENSAKMEAIQSVKNRLRYIINELENIPIT